MRSYKNPTRRFYGCHTISIVCFALAALLWAFLLLPHGWRRSAPICTAAVFFLFGLWRCFSRNIARRSQEEELIRMVFARVKYKFQ